MKDILDVKFHKENLINEVKFNNRDDTKDNNKLVRIGTIGKGGQGERVYSIMVNHALCLPMVVEEVQKLDCILSMEK